MLIRSNSDFFIKFCRHVGFKPTLFERNFPATLGWRQTPFFFDFESKFPDGIYESEYEIPAEGLEFIKSEIDKYFDLIRRINPEIKSKYEIAMVKETKRIVILPI